MARFAILFYLKTNTKIILEIVLLVKLMILVLKQIYLLICKFIDFSWIINLPGCIQIS